MEEGWKDSGNEDITAAAGEEAAIDVDPEQEHRLQFYEQRSESLATEAVLLDSQSEGSRGESDSHSHACVTVSPPGTPGRLCRIYVPLLVVSQAGQKGLACETTPQECWEILQGYPLGYSIN